MARLIRRFSFPRQRSDTRAEQLHSRPWSRDLHEKDLDVVQRTLISQLGRYQKVLQSKVVVPGVVILAAKVVSG